MDSKEFKMNLSNLENVLVPKLGKNRTIRDIEIRKSPFNGAGSIMLKVIVTLQDQNNKEELLYLLAKKIPDSELAKKMFDIQNSFKKEVCFYDVILSTLREFQKEAGLKDTLDNFALFYGARYSLDGKSEVVDDDAVMLLEDLSVKGM